MNRGLRTLRAARRGYGSAVPAIVHAARVERAAHRFRRNPAVGRIVEAWRTPGQRSVMLALAAAGASAVAFARVTEDYLTNDPLAHWDVSFAAWLAHHRAAEGVDVARVVTDVGSQLGSVVVAGVVCVVLFRRRRLADVALLPLAIGGAEALNLVLKVTFHRERPEVAFVHLDTYSY